MPDGVIVINARRDREMVAYTSGPHWTTSLIRIEHNPVAATTRAVENNPLRVSGSTYDKCTVTREA